MKVSNAGLAGFILGCMIRFWIIGESFTDDKT